MILNSYDSAGTRISTKRVKYFQDSDGYYFTVGQSSHNGFNGDASGTRFLEPIGIALFDDAGRYGTMEKTSTQWVYRDGDSRYYGELFTCRLP